MRHRLLGEYQGSCAWQLEGVIFLQKFRCPSLSFSTRAVRQDCGESEEPIARKPSDGRLRPFEQDVTWMRLGPRGAAPAVHEFWRSRCDTSYHPRVRESKNRYRHLAPRCVPPGTRIPCRKEARKCAHRESSNLCPFQPRFNASAFAVGARFHRPPVSPLIPQTTTLSEARVESRKKLEKIACGSANCLVPVCKLLLSK